MKKNVSESVLGKPVSLFPDITVVSDWFKNDQGSKLERLKAATTCAGSYSVYDVYSVYDSKGSL